MTSSHLIRDSPVMMSSTMPSTKYSCSGSALILSNGSTPIDGRSDIADIDPDAELDAPINRNCGIALVHATLDLDRAAHRVDDAGEFDQCAVAGGLDDAAAMLGDLRIDQRDAVRFQIAQRAFVIVAHQS